MINGKAEGKGVYTFANDPWKGNKYDGEWKNGKKEGKGVYTFSNGEKYDGEWKMVREKVKVC